MTQIIDGKGIAKQIREGIKNKVSGMKEKPGLAVVIVGEDPASKVYVSHKEKACERAGFYSRKIELPASISEDDLLKEIRTLNNDDKIHGILVQLPLPKGLDEKKVIKTISAEKDSDCFHAANVGKISLLERGYDLDKLLAPCTPKGIVRLIESTGVDIEGKHVVVVGRSNLVGKPIALLLLAKSATITICHSRTKDLAAETSGADILIAAVGRPKMITKEMVKKGAIVIDVGINRVGKKLVGDVDYENVKDVAGCITPVPGGVGPMTIACLLENTLLLANKK